MQAYMVTIWLYTGCLKGCGFVMIKNTEIQELLIGPMDYIYKCCKAELKRISFLRTVKHFLFAFVEVAVSINYMGWDTTITL